MLNMLKKNDLTLSKLEELEAQKKDELQKALEEKKMLEHQRLDLLLRLEEGDDAARPELSKIKSRILELDQKVEGVELFLKTMPAKKNHVRGLEIEAQLPNFQRIKKEIVPLLNEIKEKAAALNLANQKLYSLLKELDETKEVKQLRLGLSSSFYFDGLNKLHSVPRFMPGVAGSGEGKIDLELVIVALTYSKENLSSWYEEIQKTINTKVERMQDHASRLKGEETSELATRYCPKCYGKLDPWGVCEECRKQIKSFP